MNTLIWSEPLRHPLVEKLALQHTGTRVNPRITHEFLILKYLPRSASIPYPVQTRNVPHCECGDSFQGVTTRSGVFKIEFGDREIGTGGDWNACDIRGTMYQESVGVLTFNKCVGE